MSTTVPNEILARIFDYMDPAIISLLSKSWKEYIYNFGIRKSIGEVRRLCVVPHNKKHLYISKSRLMRRILEEDAKIVQREFEAKFTIPEAPVMTFFYGDVLKIEYVCEVGLEYIITVKIYEGHATIKVKEDFSEEKFYPILFDINTNIRSITKKIRCQTNVITSIITKTQEYLKT